MSRFRKGMIAGMFLALSMVIGINEAAAAEGEWFATASFDHQFAGSATSEPGCTTHDNLWNINTADYLTICTGDNPRAEFKLGYEFAFGNFRKNKWLPIMQIGYKHRSNWLTGFPFNDDKLEAATEYVFLEFKIGGIR